MHNRYKYSIIELAKITEFNVAEAIKNFKYQQDYFNKLTDFAENCSGYLNAYNPSVVVYDESSRKEFCTELEKVKKMLKVLGMNNSVVQLKNLEDALTRKNAAILSDRLLQFHASMSIIAKHILAARLSNSDSPYSL